MRSRLSPAIASAADSISAAMRASNATLASFPPAAAQSLGDPAGAPVTMTTSPASFISGLSMPKPIAPMSFAMFSAGVQLFRTPSRSVVPLVRAWARIVWHTRIVFKVSRKGDEQMSIPDFNESMNSRFLLRKPP